jgi:flagellar basal-body rod protein FlgG
MEAEQTQFNAIANDMANINTPGYQSEQVGFQDLLYATGGEATGTSVDTGSGAAASVVGRSQTEGALQQTGRPLDLAIEGAGYLQVRRSDGSIGLTRNGSLQVDAQGEITDQQGNPLAPPIKLPAGVSAADVHVAADGRVRGPGGPLGQIQIVTVPAPSQLQPDGDSLFSATTASGGTRAATGSTLRQGALESSNVDIGEAMSQMIDSERSYDMASQAVQYQDQMLQIANQLKSGS